jgi:RNA polymerase sigma-70 factor (sigma-E family)
VTYDEFVETRLPALSRFAMMLTGDHHLAQDLVQETMVRAQLHWRRVVAADVPDRYVRRMMTNLYLDWRRGSWLRRVLLWADPEDSAVRADPSAVPTDHAERSADRDLVWAVLATLPRQQRAAVVLRYYEDLSDPEIADILGCSVISARSYISKALSTLRARAGHMFEREGRR